MERWCPVYNLFSLPGSRTRQAVHFISDCCESNGNLCIMQTFTCWAAFSLTAASSSFRWYTISPVYPGSAPGPFPSWTRQKQLTWEASRSDVEPPQPAPFDVKQQLCSETLFTTADWSWSLRTHASVSLLHRAASIQITFIYVAPNLSNSLHRVRCIVR